MKIILVLLCCLLLTAGLAACGSGSSFEEMMSTPVGTGGSAQNGTTSTSNPTGNTTQPAPSVEDGARPSDALLLQDLQTELNVKVEKSFDDHVVHTIKEFTVALSQTEEKLYTASMEVLAQSIYADFVWPVEVTYTKYDQGWVMTECTWGEYSYQVKRYPSEADIVQMISAQNLGTIDKTNISCQDDTILYTYSVVANWSKYASGSATSVAKWAYDRYEDGWEYRTTTSYNVDVAITKELEGKWKLDGESGYAIIDNVTDTGFDIDVTATYYSVSRHVSFSDAVITKSNGGTMHLTFQSTGGKRLDIEMFLPKNGTDYDLKIEIWAFDQGGFDLCGSEIINSTSKINEIEYYVQIHSTGGLPLQNVDISIFDGGSLAGVGRTDADGACTLRLPANRSYNIKLSNVPDGYTVRSSYSFTGNSAEISLTSSVITSEKINHNTRFALGDIMYDFEFTDSDGVKHKLSETLAENKMVVLNFWYSSSWCQAEHVAINAVYGEFADQIEVFALNSFGETMNDVLDWKTSLNLDMPMGLSANGLNINSFGSNGYPTTVIIDRYGMIAMIQAGSITTASHWQQIFEYFTAKDYEQKLVEDFYYEIIVQQVTEVFPGNNAISHAISSGNSNVTYSSEVGDEYAWPFVVTNYRGESCIKASNTRVNDSYAIIRATVKLKAGQAVCFDYIISSEQDMDIAYVIVNDKSVYQMSGHGDSTQWKTCYPWVALEDGVYEVVICYIKDSTESYGDDTIYINNLRIINKEDIAEDCYIPREAAVENEYGEFSYVEIFYNKTDGYYHVGSVNGPLLLANLFGYTQLCEYDYIYNMAANGEIVKNGHNYYDDLLPYCSYAASSAIAGYCPVTAQLAEILKVVAEIYGYEGVENEWLKVCEYYEAYGPNGTQMEVLIQGLMP